MKKIILTLLSLVLICTMCIGFVACDENDVDGNGDTSNDVQQPTPEEPETISLFNFAKSTEFSFGGFVEDIIFGDARREAGQKYTDSQKGEATAAAVDPSNRDIPVLLIENDVFFEQIMEKFQELYDENADEYLQEHFVSEDLVEGFRGQKLSDFAERKKGAFASIVSKQNNLTTYEEAIVGEFVNNSNRRILDKKETEKYSVISAIEFQEKGYNAGIRHIVVEMQTQYIQRSSGLSISFNSVIEYLWYTGDLENIESVEEFARIRLITQTSTALLFAIKNSPYEELYEMGKPYFDIMEEVVDAWLKDPRGQAYINKYAQ